MRKRTLSLALAVSMAAMSLAGCGGGGTTATTAAAGGETTAAASEAATEAASTDDSNLYRILVLGNGVWHLHECIGFFFYLPFMHESPDLWWFVRVRCCGNAAVPLCTTANIYHGVTDPGTAPVLRSVYA